MAFAFHYRIDTDFSVIKQRVLGRGVELGRAAIESTDSDSPFSVLKELETQLGYRVRVIPHDDLPIAIQRLLNVPEDVMVHAGNELTVLAPMKNRTDVLQLGPVSIADGRIETDMVVAIGGVLTLVAIAIAILLRPLARQLNVLEDAAVSIASGNLGARVDVEKTDSAKTLARAFNEMATRTETLLKAQRELLQSVSHELRTPLARISFAIDLIRSARDDEEREPRLKSLDTAAQELDELVGELLQYVRLETNLPQSQRECIDLLLLVKDLIEKASLTCEHIQFEFGLELDRGDLTLIADRNALSRVLSNLIANACRFSRQRIVIDAVVNAAGTTIDVDDDGPGIPIMDRERIFDPFVRLDETTHGTGLGLALVKRITANSGGTVKALESPFGGCRIRSFWPTQPQSYLGAQS